MAKRKEGVTPSPAPQGETPSGIRVNWKAKAERLQAEYVTQSVTIAGYAEENRGLLKKVLVMGALAESREKTIDLKTDGIKFLKQDVAILKDEVARLETVIKERAETIERLTVGIDQYQKDIASHVAMADDRNAYIDELKAKITELEGLSQVAAQLYDRGINAKEAQNAAERIRWQAYGEYYRATIEAYRRDVERIPRWLRKLFLSSPMQEG